MQWLNVTLKNIILKYFKYGWCADVENYTLTSNGEITVGVALNKKDGSKETGSFQAGWCPAHRIFLNFYKYTCWFK